MAKKLFFIDDDETFRYLMERTCRKIDEVERLDFAANGQAALEQIGLWLDQQYALPDLMFVDINMPLLNGFEFLSAFKALQEARQELRRIVPIVMLTSSLHEEDREKAYSTGIVDEFVIKPFDASGLEQIVRQFVQ